MKKYFLHNIVVVLFTKGMSMKSTGLEQENNQDYKREESERSSIVQELCESRGGRSGLSVLTSLLVSVDVKIY